MNRTDSPFPGSPIARGPMGGDQFTQVHNLVFRDPTLSAKAMGVFGHLSTHTEQWRVNEKTVAANMRDGRDSVRAALRELEQHSYLIRARERRADGSLGEAVWFVTDLPAQFRALGISDDTVVTAKVREHFEQWQNARSEPTTENPSLGLTCENSITPPSGTSQPVDNSQKNPSFPSAAPKSENPTLANPTLANPHTKNTNAQNINSTEPPSLRSGGSVEQEHHPSSSVSEVQTAHEDPSSATETGAESSELPPADGWMDGPTSENGDTGSQDRRVATHPHRSAVCTSQQTSGGERSRETANTPGSALLAMIENRHGAHLHGQRAQHVAAIDAALAVVPERTVAACLGDGLDQARTPAGALVERIREQLPVLVSEREQRKQQAHRPQRRSCAKPTPVTDSSSPVSWLTDEQFATLKLQEQAHVRSAGETPLDQLTPMTARVITEIQNSLAKEPAHV